MSKRVNQNNKQNRTEQHQNDQSSAIFKILRQTINIISSLIKFFDAFLSHIQKP